MEAGRDPNESQLSPSPAEQAKYPSGLRLLVQFCWKAGAAHLSMRQFMTIIK